MRLVSECPKGKTNSDKTLQTQTTNKLNGEKSQSDDSDNSNKDKLITKEPILNGTQNSNIKVVNGDPKNVSHCDISSSKVVSNGVNSDSDDTKSNRSDESQDAVIQQDVPAKVALPKTGSKKKDKKLSEKNKAEDKKVSVKAAEAVKSVEEDSDKSKADSKMVNGEKERESTPSEDADEKKRDAEVVFIQDLGFTVKIVSPKAEPLDIQVWFIASYKIYVLWYAYIRMLLAGIQHGACPRDTSGAHGSRRHLS